MRLLPLITLLVASLFSSLVLANDRLISTPIELYQPAHHILPAIIQNTSRLELNIATQWNTKNNARNLESASVTGSIWLRDFIQILLQEKNNDLTNDLTPELYVGKENLQIQLNADWKDDGNLQSSIEFKENGQKTELPILIKNKTFGEIQLRIKELNWSAKGLVLQKEERKNIDVSLACLLEQKNNVSEKQSRWSQVDCSAKLEFNTQQNTWFYRILLKPRSAIPPRTTLQNSCFRHPEEIQKDLNAILSHFNHENVEFPYIINNPNYATIEATANSEKSPLKLKAALFIRPQVGKVKIPGAPLGLYVNVPDDSIVSVCVDSPQTVVVNFFKISKKFYVFGEKQINESKVSVRWSLLEPLTEKVFNIVEKIPVAGILANPLERIVSPVLALPRELISQFTPVSDINQIVVTPEEITVGLNGLLIKKFKIPVNNKGL